MESRLSLFAFRSSFRVAVMLAISQVAVAKSERRKAISEPRLSCYNHRVMVSPKMLEILVCPVCRKPLVLRGEESLKCNECKRVYPIRNGIPIMLEHEATIETL